MDQPHSKIPAQNRVNSVRIAGRVERLNPFSSLERPPGSDKFQPPRVVREGSPQPPGSLAMNGVLLIVLCIPLVALH